jgi:uncharacterized protein (TIGR03382 family)
MKSSFRGSLATLVGSVALLVAPAAFAQTQPDDSGPHYPAGPAKECSIALPGHGNSATGLAMTLGLIGLGVVVSRRRR